MSKKLKSLSDLNKIKFEELVSDQEETFNSEADFSPQHLEAHFSKKGRAGKIVTLIKGFKGERKELISLAKILKQTLNVGGTVKNGQIVIQGNLRNQIVDKLNEMGHHVKSIGG